VTTAPAEVVQTRPSRSSRTSSWRHESAAGPSTTNVNTSRSNEDARASLPATSSTASEEIIVLDSDEDMPVRDSSKGKKRKRQARQKRNDTLDLDSKEEHDEPAKRTKTQLSSARPSMLASGSGDIIIIDD
jgi:hypothetical protein